EEADNGRLALELLNIEKFDLVLLYIKMHDMNGIEVLKAIRANDKLNTLPVMMMSAIDDLHTIKKCLEIGAVDYLQK
ncbi:adenylate/guanylate cyclase domain-containing response regulator, partial [Enterococcus hirae]